CRRPGIRPPPAAKIWSFGTNSTPATLNPGCGKSSVRSKEMPSTTADIRVADFVRGLALAWKNLAAYPSGHPALAGALESVPARLAELRGRAGEVILGIADDGLLHGDTKIDSLYAQKLAHALHLRGVAVMRFSAAT